MNIDSLKEWGIFPENNYLIAGPCSAESKTQVMETATALKALGINVFRAGLWKPRTLPGGFEGVGSKGLEWLISVQQELGMKVITEVSNKEHVNACVDAGIDMVWIGARTTTNPFLVQELAETLTGHDIPVLIKNPVNQDLQLWIGAIERFHRAGLRKIAAVHRGFSTIENIKYRNTPQWQIAIELKTKYPSLPVFCDPSHIAGDTQYICEIAQRAMNLGLDGLMIESHCSPSEAMSDAKQQLSPTELKELLHYRLQLRQRDSESSQWKDNISQLREEIDIIDESIISALRNRMEICKEIARVKKANNISILQSSRWDAVLEQVLKKGNGLSETFLIDIFNKIHEESVEIQNKIISDDSSRQI